MKISNIMTTNNRKGPIVDPGVCRCCGATKKCRLLNTEYEWLGQKEIYSEMFVEIFGLLLSHLDGEPEERVICATCVTRLRDAGAFRRQVLRHEEKLLQGWILVHGKESFPKLEVEVKAEPHRESDSDEPLMEADDAAAYSDTETDSKTETEPLKSVEIEIKSVKTKAVTTRSGKVKQNRAAKELISNLQRVKMKLDKMLDKDKPDGEINGGIKHDTVLKVENNGGASDIIPDDDVAADTADHVVDDDNDSDNMALIEVKGQPLSKTLTKSKKSLKKNLNKPKKSNKKEKKSRVKRKTSKKTIKSESLKAKKEMMAKLKLMRDKLDELEQIDLQENPELRLIKPKEIDTEHRAFKNTVTIVENSYVCPFDTSFSDYFCIYCRQVFTDPNKLREHTLSHDPTSFKDSVTNKKLLQIDVLRVDCRLCLEQIDDIDIFRNHITKVHQKELFPIKNEFLKFRLTATNLTCIECNSQFSFFHALKKHMAEHFGTCICDMCGAHYFEERMLTLHQKTHQRIEEIYPCKDCGKTFKSKHSRHLHEAKLHKKEPAYQCPKCDEVLFSYTLRYRHMIDVHGEERMFQCDHCDRSYDSRKSLREHNRRFHLKILKHQCDLCDKRFYLPSRLKEHMATHTGERNFRCEYCGKSYPRLRGLKVHMQSHSNEKKYRCMLCNASFTQNVNLKNHVKRQHQNLGLDESFH